MLAAQHCVCTKSGLKNEFTTRYVHVWRGEEVQRTRFFFNDVAGTIQEEGTAFRMYLAIVCSGKRLLPIYYLCWSIFRELFQAPTIYPTTTPKIYGLHPQSKLGGKHDGRNYHREEPACSVGQKVPVKKGSFSAGKIVKGKVWKR